jgi:hypothetical protein
MIGPKVSAEDGSTAIGGNVHAPVVNVNAAVGSTVNVSLEQKIIQELPSFLGRVIVIFSRQSLAKYGRGRQRALSVEVSEKVAYNKLSDDHPVLIDYRRYSLVLEESYLGVEQQNADARYLVRRKAAIAYQLLVREGCKQNSIPSAHKIEYVKANADGIVENVITRLLEDYKASNDLKVEQETAHLAISLIVADAVVECEVLERP